MIILAGNKKLHENDLTFCLQSKAVSIDFEIIYEKFCFIGSFVGRGTDRAKIQEKYPNVHFSSLRQSHSDTVVEFNHRTDLEPFGDAGITGQDCLAPVIKTADCLPLMVVGIHSGIVASIHAGWKGVASQIHLKTLELMKAQSGPKERFICVIGPHIHQKSFEIDPPVLQILCEASKLTGLNPETYFYRQGRKFHFDLLGLVGDQLESQGLNKYDLIHVGGNTVDQEIWNSYRREQEKALRNLNFVFKVTKS